jgi:hypothetical protein
MGPLLKLAVDFGIGFLQGYAQAAADQRNQPSFADCMAYLARETGHRLSMVREISAWFDIEAGSETYSVVVVLKGDEVSINAMSNLTFARGRAPSDICEFLVEHNKTLAHCDFDLLNGTEGDKFIIKAKVRCEALTPTVFEAALREMVPRMIAFDHVLVQKGYA